MLFRVIITNYEYFFVWLLLDLSLSIYLTLSLIAKLIFWRLCSCDCDWLRCCYSKVVFALADIEVDVEDCIGDSLVTTCSLAKTIFLFFFGSLHWSSSYQQRDGYSNVPIDNWQLCDRLTAPQDDRWMEIVWSKTGGSLFTACCSCFGGYLA